MISAIEKNHALQRGRLGELSLRESIAQDLLDTGPRVLGVSGKSRAHPGHAGRDFVESLPGNVALEVRRVIGLDQLQASVAVQISIVNPQRLASIVFVFGVPSPVAGNNI